MVKSTLKEIREIGGANNTDYVSLLQFIVALHDIGKPEAIKVGDKFRQHEFTVPILESMMKKLGYSESEIRLAKALVGNDVLGGVVKGAIPPNEAFDRLSTLAASTGLSVKDFFTLQSFLYTIDAASYPALRASVFQQTGDGRLVPKTDRFAQLQSLVDTSRPN